VNGEAPVVVPANLALDILALASALPLAVFTLGCGLYFLIFPDTIEPLGPSIPFLSKPTSDMVITCGALMVATVWLCARGFGALRRALDRRPMLVADTDGITFHPALCAKAVPWRDVRHIRSAGFQDPYHLAIDLQRRIWSIEAPLGARRVRIGALYLGPAYGSFPPDDLIASLIRLQDSTKRDDQPT
jgi:hypothetical protein